MKEERNSYFKNIKDSVSTTVHGAKLTLGHFKKAITTDRRTPESVSAPGYFEKEGIETLYYPEEKVPVPVNGRYQLHNEIEDCIVCDKCAKVCPVNCIEIESIKSSEVIGHTSDGTAKRLYPAKFNIDLAKCCYCGLCTTVCPTECLTMTNDFDFSEFNLEDLDFKFSKMTEEEVQDKRLAYEAQQEAKKQSSMKAETTSSETASKPKPKFRPRARVSAKSDS
ncbi:4Fe-4S binding protein [Sediminitomix flava]|uniref:Formate hydrogenlyase subunit 6/NADH:ubiquinone oxidoreductase subunit I n=1 Tax=Sediminitomix flava TaxID=379075 RepID=A0A315ZFN9_SEDFL|nr:4Fe-4S binding protein [Sediminitomix flava]PWJ44132.1 formate hydrogenlyase subunit 6/NADH:ubiquinone oxidoreductase subunit I [Sediminitomix flava]